MKNFFYTLISVLMISATSFAQSSVSPSGSTQEGNTATAVNPNAGEFKWTAETHDFGTIPMSIKVKNKFEFTNTGKEPIIITNVQKSCGCTPTEWSKEPIMPGATGFVIVEFNAAKEGPFTKAVTVQSDSKTPSVKLIIKGTVQKSEQTDGVPEQNSIFNSGGN